MAEFKTCTINGRTYRIGDVVVDMVQEATPKVRVQAIEGPLEWFVVQTNPQCEARAEGGLREAGLDVYLPRFSRWQKIARPVPRGPQKREVQFPLFSGYLFIGSNKAAGPDWKEISETDGVRRVLGVQGGKERLGDGVLNRVRDIEVECRRQFGVGTGIKPGSTVRITTGPFAQFCAQLVAMADDDRVRVLVSIFGRSTEMTLPVDGVEVVG